MPRPKKTFKILLFLFTSFLFGAVFYGAFLLYKLNYLEKKITIDKTASSSILETIKNFSSGDTSFHQNGKDRINILLLGLPGKGKPGQNLTDTIMLASVNLKTYQVALLSIPRDLYVEVPDTNHLNMKINSVYQYQLNQDKTQPEKSASVVKDIVSQITGLPIDYYLVVNFDGFIQVIDSLGGINIENERDIYDARYPGPNYSYETFELKKGFHHLDGATALKYARERHDDPQGDFGRAKRQQQILQATKNKIFSTQIMLNVRAINDLINALGDNIKTDILPEEMNSFIELSRQIDTNNINNVVLTAWDAGSLLKVSHVFFGNTRAFVLIPRAGNYSEIHELAENIFDLNILKRKQEEIAKENATIILINKSGEKKLIEKIKRLFQESFGYKNVVVLEDRSPIPEEKTFVYDFSLQSKPFTINEIITKLPAERKENLAISYEKNIENISSDLIVILGKDIISRYSLEDASFEEYNKANDTNEYLEFRNQEN